MREAVEQGQIVPYFQPIVDYRTGNVHRLELLARWPNAPGTIGPDVFMPVITRRIWRAA